MRELTGNEKRMHECFFGAVYHCYEKYGDTELTEYQLRQFNFSFPFPADKKHKLTFGEHEVILENEYFRMHYKNLDPKRERYLTPHSELIIITIEEFASS